MIWKLLMGIIVEKLYRHLERNGLLVNDEQKGCRKGSRGTKDQLLVDKTVVKNCRRKLTNLSMAWIDDMVPPFVDAEMPGDGWCSHKYDLCNQQQHGEQAPVVKIVDSAIRWINLCPSKNSTGFPYNYPPDSDLSCGYGCPLFEQLEPRRQSWHQVK